MNRWFDMLSEHWTPNTQDIPECLKSVRLAYFCSNMIKVYQTGQSTLISVRSKMQVYKCCYITYNFALIGDKNPPFCHFTKMPSVCYRNRLLFCSWKSQNFSAATAQWAAPRVLDACWRWSLPLRPGFPVEHEAFVVWKQQQWWYPLVI